LNDIGSRPITDTSAKAISAILRFDRLGAQSGGRPFQNLAVLDGVCRSGDICLEALAFGAASVTGLCRSRQVAEAAKAECPQGTFIDGSWQQLPLAKFDVVVLSCDDDTELPDKAGFRRLEQCLTANATLILRCVVVRDGVQSSGWRTKTINGKPVRVPVNRHLIENVLACYDVRQLNREAVELDSQLQRIVLHCFKREHVAILIAGKSNIGKSNLARLLRQRNIPCYSTDELLVRLVNSEKYKMSGKLDKLLEQKFSAGNLAVVSHFIEKNDLAEPFSELIASECPREFPMFVIEGEALNHPGIFEQACKKLRKNNLQILVLRKAGKQ
jgi:hypothetical protein